jgi:septal ring factor EnvC (AmiA/AmiB activator)
LSDNGTEIGQNFNQHFLNGPTLTQPNNGTPKGATLISYLSPYPLINFFLCSEDSHRLIIKEISELKSENQKLRTSVDEMTKSLNSSDKEEIAFFRARILSTERQISEKEKQISEKEKQMSQMLSTKEEIGDAIFLTLYFFT